MTRTLDNFLKEEQQKKERVEKLAQSIIDAKKTLTQTRTEYEGAVISDNDKETNRLFKEIERLENQIKADEHKLTTLRTVTDKHLRQSAIDTIRTFPSEVHAKHKAKADEALKQVEQSRQKYIESLSVLDGLNEAYNAERNEYRPLLHRYDLQKREVENKDSLYNKVDDLGTVAPNKTDMIVTYQHIREGLDKQ